MSNGHLVKFLKPSSRLVKVQAGAERENITSDMRLRLHRNKLKITQAILSKDELEAKKDIAIMNAHIQYAEALLAHAEGQE